MRPDDRLISRVAIFGKSVEMWPVAALLGVSLPERVEFVVVEDQDASSGPMAVTLACDNRLHGAIGLELEELVAQCNATLGLGTVLRDWQGAGSRFFLAPSGTLPTIDGVAMHHIMLRAAHLYEEPDRLAHLYQPLRFCARAALAGKFALGPDQPISPQALLRPTVQIDRADYAALLKRKCAGAAAQLHRAKPIGVQMRSEGSAIRSVEIGDGTAIEADWFIDVSGNLSRLLPEAMSPPSQALAFMQSFDRIIRGFRNDAETGHTTARAVENGLLVETPLAEGAVSELLVSSSHFDDALLQPLVGDEAVNEAFAPYVIEAPWRGNMARLGSASAQFGPYMSADVLLLHEQVQHLVDSIPAGNSMEIEASEFNRKHSETVAQIRDFTAVPFALNRRADPLWAAFRAIELSETLRIRLGQFESRGRFVTFDQETFDEQSWIELMVGFGITPERYNAIAATLDMPAVAPRLKAMVARFNRAIDDMPGHADFVGSFRAAAQAQHPR